MGPPNEIASGSANRIASGSANRIGLMGLAVGLAWAAGAAGLVGRNGQAGLGSRRALASPSSTHEVRRDADGQEEDRDAPQDLVRFHRQRTGARETARLLGMAPIDLYEIIRQRYQRGTVALTSNRAVDELPALFGDPLLAGAAMDRLLHGAHVVTLDGDSYRNPPPERIRRQTRTAQKEAAR